MRCIFFNHFTKGTSLACGHFLEAALFGLLHLDILALLNREEELSRSPLVRYDERLLMLERVAYRVEECVVTVVGCNQQVQTE